MTALPNAWNVHTIRRRIVARLVRSMAGARVTDGGEPGTLVRCHECDGTALLHKLDRLPVAVPATEEPESGTFWERSVLRRFADGEPVDVDTVRAQVKALLAALPTPPAEASDADVVLALEAADQGILDGSVTLAELSTYAHYAQRLRGQFVLTRRETASTTGSCDA